MKIVYVMSIVRDYGTFVLRVYEDYQEAMSDRKKELLTTHDDVIVEAVELVKK